MEESIKSTSNIEKTASELLEKDEVVINTIEQESPLIEPDVLIQNQEQNKSEEIYDNEVQKEVNSHYQEQKIEENSNEEINLKDKKENDIKKDILKERNIKKEKEIDEDTSHRKINSVKNDSNEFSSSKSNRKQSIKSVSISPSRKTIKSTSEEESYNKEESNRKEERSVSLVKEFTDIAEAILENFEKRDSSPMKIPSNFINIIANLCLIRMDEMHNAISSANKLAELSFRPGFIPTSELIDDILFPSLSGFIELLKSLTKELINIMKRFGNNFSSINKDTNKNEKTREESSLIYPIDVVSNIQSLLNTSLNEFCQITHELESENNLPEFIIPRVDLLSSITTAVETCAFYIEVYRGCETPINSHTQIILSNALAVFRATVVPILLNPLHERARNEIYKEINECIEHTERMLTLVIFGDRNKYKGENYLNFRSESQSPNSRYRFDINNESKPKKKKSNKKDKNETSSTENKTKTSTKHKKIISQENPSSPEHPIYAIQRTPTGTRVPLGMVVDKEGYETWSEHVDRMGFHIQTHPDKLDEEIIRRQMEVKKSNWKVNGEKKELEFNEGCMSRKRNESKERKKKRIKKIKKELDEKRSNGEEEINEGDKSNEKRRRRIKSKEEDGKSEEESDSLTGDEESKK